MEFVKFFLFNWEIIVFPDFMSFEFMKDLKYENAKIRVITWKTAASYELV